MVDQPGGVASTLPSAVSAAFAAAREALARLPIDRATPALGLGGDPDPSRPSSVDALLAVPDPIGGGHALRVLAHVDAAEAAPHALAAVEGLLERANELRFGHLERIGAGIVDACIAESRQRVRVGASGTAPDFIAPTRLLREEAPTLARAVELFRGRYDGGSWYALWSLVGVAMQRWMRDQGIDVMAAITRERAAQAGIGRYEEEALRQARIALGACAAALPFDDFVRALEQGMLVVGQANTALVASRPELRDPQICQGLLERLLLSDELGVGHTVVSTAVGNLLVERLGEATHAPACELLVLLACSAVTLRAAATVALGRFDSEMVRPALVARLVRRVEARLVHFDPHHPLLEVLAPLELLLSVGGGDPFDVLAPFFAPERLATGCGAAVVMQIASLARGRFVGRPHAVIALLERPAPPPQAIADDPRWIERWVSLLPHRLLAGPARAALDVYDAAAVKAALGRATAEAKGRRSAAAPDPAPAPARRADLHERYVAGRTDEVWTELRAIGAAAADPAIAADVRAVCDEAMRRVRANLELFLSRLRKAKVPLKPKAKTLPAAGPKLEELTAKLEAKLGAPLPPAVRAFYAIVGGVDFSSAVDGRNADVPPAAFGGVPLVVVPCAAATKLFVTARGGYTKIPAALRPRASLYVAPDPEVRRDWSRGDDAPTYVFVDEPVADPAVEGADAPTFVELLRRAIAAGGFTGSSGVPAAVVAGLAPF